MKRFIISVSIASCLLLFQVAGNAFASENPFIARHGINFSTGNKYIREHDVTIASPIEPLYFSRNYNSQSREETVFGHGWTFSENENLQIQESAGLIIHSRSDGHLLHFYADGSGKWTNGVGKAATIAKIADGYELRLPDGGIKAFNAAGKIVSRKDRKENQISYSYEGSQLTGIADSFGHALTLAYNADGMAEFLTTPVGKFTYAYDANKNLISVTNPDGKQRKYLYEDAQDIHNLTGILDENNTRILTAGYDEIDRVISSAFINGREKVTIAYQPDYKRTVTDALGAVTTYQLEVRNGVAQVQSFTGPGCASCGDDDGSSYVYNSRNQAESVTDAKGGVTTYSYDDAGNRIAETNAAGTPLAKTTAYTYTPQNQIATITEPSVDKTGQDRITTMTYDAGGNMLTRTVSGYSGGTPASQTTDFTYDTFGRIISVDGPRTDVNDTLTLTYYPNEISQGANRGQLHTVTNSLGQTTTYSDYTSSGKPGFIIDVKGLITNFTYNFRGQMLTRSIGGLTTSFTYDDAGRLLTATTPNTGVVTYTYAGSQIATVTDSLGNRISYTYDAQGQRTGQEVHDPAQTLTASLHHAYDDSGRISKVIYPDNAEESYSYDAAGNLTAAVSPKGIRTDTVYDVLNRVLRITEAGTATAAYAYDQHDNISSFTDAKGKITRFTYDDFGNMLTATAPDTGRSVAAYDAAGNLLTLTDAKNQTVAYSYDALSRPIRQSYPGAARELVFTYDQGTIGQLTAIQEEESSRAFTYSNLGQLAEEARTLGSKTAVIRYSYDSATGELASMTYPSGRVLAFVRNAAGQITGLQLDGTPLLANGAYLPFGPLNKADLGSVKLNRNYDQRYQVSRIQAAGLEYAYSRDKAGLVTEISGLPAPDITSGTQTASYSPDNNQLTAVSGNPARTYAYDANGNIISDGTYAFTWDALNRLAKVTKAGATVATYAYDSQNRRIRKTAGGKTIHYHYDRNNLLIGESLADGTPLRDYFYLHGEPIALREYARNPGLYYFINDHLGTPQQVVTADGTVVWKAAYFPYGAVQIQVATVENNLRFPGQYYDAETGLHYNWNRYYDPSAGRYISADPIGLDGGINLYSYVNENPINWIDPSGNVVLTPRQAQLALKGVKDWWKNRDGTDVTLFLNNLEWVTGDNGCKYVCWSISTDIVGFGATWDPTTANHESPVTTSIGLGKNLALSVDIASIATGTNYINKPTTSYSLGLAIGFPIGTTVRLRCFALTKFDSNGCPCNAKLDGPTTFF